MNAKTGKKPGEAPKRTHKKLKPASTTGKRNEQEANLGRKATNE